MNDMKRLREEPVVPKVSWIFYLCFLFSGSAGLVYEILWERYLSLFLGNSGLAQMIVLATFMGGMALGSHLFGRVADRQTNPVKLYAFLELAAGLYAALFPILIVHARTVFLWAATAFPFESVAMTGLKLTTCVGTILLPSILMGGTLPAMTRWLVRQADDTGLMVARLYFVNSAGAVIGCLLSAFVLIPWLGLDASLLVGGLAGVGAGLVAWIFSAHLPLLMPAGPASSVLETQPATIGSGPGALRALLGIAAVSGAVSMFYEVAWIRMLVLVVGSSSYAFALMLATFILGLSLGGFALSFRRWRDYAAVLAVCELGVGITVLASIGFYVRLPFWFNQIASQLVRDSETFGTFQVVVFLLCAGVMLVPTILQGATFPAAVHLFARGSRHTGTAVGTVLAFNTVGVLAGSILATTVGLPVLGLKSTLEIGVVLNGCLAILVVWIWSTPGLRTRRLAATAALLMVAGGWYLARLGNWNVAVMNAGAYRWRHRIASFDYFVKMAESSPILFHRDGTAGSVMVRSRGHGPSAERLLVINGKVDASSQQDIPTQKMLGLLPILQARDPKRVLVVGVGSGATIGTVLACPQVESVDALDISPDVVTASRFFGDVNREYWKDPRVRIVCEDAKTFLQVGRIPYDVIISEPSNPWMSGIPNVFSTEFFMACRQRLAPDGLMVQWVQTYEMDNLCFFTILDTFSGIFPCYTIWNPLRTDTLIIGSVLPVHPDFTRMQDRLSSPAMVDECRMMGVQSLFPILLTQVANYAEVPARVPWIGLRHSDAFPILERMAAEGFYTGVTVDGVRWLDQRPLSSRAGRLWITDYIRGQVPSTAEWQNAYRYVVQNDSIWPGLRAVAAREWYRLDASNDEARLAFILETGMDPDASSSTAKLQSPLTPAGYQVAVERCRLRFAQYVRERHCLQLPDSTGLARELRVLLDASQTNEQARLHYWLGCLLADTGQYADAAEQLATSLDLVTKVGEPVPYFADLAESLSDCWIRTGRPGAAHDLVEELVRQGKGGLRSRIILTKVNNAGFKGD
ncbi:MAG: hypothetical protein A2498_01515 [Lentisphaerae bacterium RIFOXYC12_FULL_60_16]|nr:MAG: hypothetical protein A2498_01515 [Lentisphaerae bacterium RIFOXYC12_FULL_60_16]OGV75156.1 MAG: hypothetical protein A2340_05590 [Lentisphaerae bacterium RIFOXYB12_FULL_60_10]